MSNRPENTIVGQVQNGFIARMMRYSPPAIVVWLALANRADASGQSRPSISTLQNDTGLARSTVYKAVDELVEKGEISVVPGGGKGNQSNSYTIEGSPRNGLVQSANQSKLRTKVVQTTDKGSPWIGLKPNTRTKHKNQTGRAPAKKFIQPTISDVAAYCRTRKNKVDPQHFIDHYESNGWKIGRNPMKDWQAAVRTWERNGFSNGEAKKPSEPIKYRA